MKAIIGSAALAAGTLTRGQLRARYDRVLTDVYLPKKGDRTVTDYAEAAWLWSGGSGIVTGATAAALHGVRWIEPSAPIELITARRSLDPRLITRKVRHHADEVVTSTSGMLVATPARTALDIARHMSLEDAVQHLDALAAATDVSRIEIATLARRYRRAANISQSRYALRLMDGGSGSRYESSLRLAMINAGFPRPATAIRVSEGMTTVVVALGWEQQRIGLSCAVVEGPSGPIWHQLTRDNFLQLQGWINLHVSPRLSLRSTVYRVSEAFRVQRRRGL